MDIFYSISVFGLAMMLAHGATNTKMNDLKREGNSQLMTELVFDKGSKDLSVDARTQLHQMLADAERQGGIGEVTIIAWGDEDAPTTSGKKLDQEQREIADSRSYEIRSYIESNTIKTNTQTFNMAEQPNALEKFMHTSPNVKLKESLESAGLVHPPKVGAPPKASHALVLVTLR